jgi:hypothetical protein
MISPILIPIMEVTCRRHSQLDVYMYAYISLDYDYFSHIYIYISIYK